MSAQRWWRANLAVLLIGLSLSALSWARLRAHEQTVEVYRRHASWVEGRTGTYVSLINTYCYSLGNAYDRCVDQHRALCQAPPP